MGTSSSPTPRPPRSARAQALGLARYLRDGRRSRAPLMASVLLALAVFLRSEVVLLGAAFAFAAVVSSLVRRRLAIRWPSRTVAVIGTGVGLRRRPNSHPPHASAPVSRARRQLPLRAVMDTSSIARRASSPRGSNLATGVSGSSARSSSSSWSSASWWYASCGSLRRTPAPFECCAPSSWASPFFVSCSPNRPSYWFLGCWSRFLSCSGESPASTVRSCETISRSCSRRRASCSHSEWWRLSTPIGGGFEWGGRYFAVGLPCATPLAAAGLQRFGDASGPRW